MKVAKISDNAENPTSMSMIAGTTMSRGNAMPTTGMEHQVVMGCSPVRTMCREAV